MPIFLRSRMLITVASVGSLVAVAACSSEPVAPDPFTELPVACDLIKPETTQRVVGTSNGASKLKTDRSDRCSWEHRAAEVPEPPPGGGVAPYRRALHVSVTLHRPSSEGVDFSGVDLAEDVFNGQRQDAGLVGKGSVDGIGDAAYINVDDRSGTLKFRQGNITGEVRFEGMGSGPSGATSGLGEDAIHEAITKAAEEVNAQLA